MESNEYGINREENQQKSRSVKLSGVIIGRTIVNGSDNQALARTISGTV